MFRTETPHFEDWVPTDDADLRAREDARDDAEANAREERADALADNRDLEDYRAYRRRSRRAWRRKR